MLLTAYVLFSLNMGYVLKILLINALEVRETVECLLTILIYTSWKLDTEPYS